MKSKRIMFAVVAFVMVILPAARGITATLSAAAESLLGVYHPVTALMPFHQLSAGGSQDPARVFPMIAKGPTAVANWAVRSACGFTDLTVIAEDGIGSADDTTAPNPPTHVQFVFVVMLQFDSCANQGFLAQGLVTPPADAFHIDPSSRGAFVQTTVPMTCVESVIFPTAPCPFSSVDVNLTWNPQGEIQRFVSTDTFVCPGFLVSNENTKDRIAFASAVGDVSANGASLVSSLSLVPDATFVDNGLVTRVFVRTPLSQPVQPCHFVQVPL